MCYIPTASRVNMSLPSDLHIWPAVLLSIAKQDISISSVYNCVNADIILTGNKILQNKMAIHSAGRVYSLHLGNAVVIISFGMM